LDAVRKLLNEGADPNGRFDWHSSSGPHAYLPLEFAIERSWATRHTRPSLDFDKSLMIIGLLLEHGADLSTCSLPSQDQLTEMRTQRESPSRNRVRPREESHGDISEIMIRNPNYLVTTTEFSPSTEKRFDSLIADGHEVDLTGNLLDPRYISLSWLDHILSRRAPESPPDIFNAIAEVGILKNLPDPVIGLVADFRGGPEHPELTRQLSEMLFGKGRFYFEQVALFILVGARYDDIPGPSDARTCMLRATLGMIQLATLDDDDAVRRGCRAINDSLPQKWLLAKPYRVAWIKRSKVWTAGYRGGVNGD